MKSLCIKTNNQKILNYLVKNLEVSSLENIYFIQKEFKCYKNVIVHYLGANLDMFLENFSEILAECIIVFYEPILLRKFLNFHYFYFDKLEKKMIEQDFYEYIALEETNTLKNRKDKVKGFILDYISENKSMILDGFVTFRLKDYIVKLEDDLDYVVQQYVIQKEYNEFISLLKLYIDSKVPETRLIHLIYSNNESILLDENKKIIHLDDSIFSTAYLSDISFSSNDYALNALLTLLPEKLKIHLVVDDNDEFIDTLKLIFGARISICTNCNLCKTYRILNNVKF